MLNKIKKIIVIILGTSTLFLTILAILSIWGVIHDDIAIRSLATMGVLLGASATTLVITKIVDEENKK